VFFRGDGEGFGSEAAGMVSCAVFGCSVFSAVICYLSAARVSPALRSTVRPCGRCGVGVVDDLAIAPSTYMIRASCTGEAVKPETVAWGSVVCRGDLATMVVKVNPPTPYNQRS
jgi:hypothetical protein